MKNARQHPFPVGVMPDQRAGDGHQHSGLAREDAAARGHRRVHPLQRKNEERAGDDVDVIDQGAHYFFSSLRLNILSMRSVIRKPLTMLVLAARDGDEAEHFAHGGGFVVADDHDGAHHGDGGNRVGERHQRRVQQGRNPANHLQADEGRQHEDVQSHFQVRRHDALPPQNSYEPAAVRPSNSRTFGCTTSPPCVTSVSRTISSSRSSASLPSLIRYLRKVAMFLAYIWLA